MKRFHVHVGVADLDQSIGFYSRLFGAQPAVVKSDYAKWMLEDPRVNFAISTRGSKTGIDHLGLQVDDAAEFAALERQVRSADAGALEEKAANCCYARSDKHWALDPQGIAWEAFHTLDSVPMYGDDTGRASQEARTAEVSSTCGCPMPVAARPAAESACCGR